MFVFTCFVNVWCCIVNIISTNKHIHIWISNEFVWNLFNFCWVFKFCASILCFVCSCKICIPACIVIFWWTWCVKTGHTTFKSVCVKKMISNWNHTSAVIYNSTLVVWNIFYCAASSKHKHSSKCQSKKSFFPIFHFFLQYELYFTL